MALRAMHFRPRPVRPPIRQRGAKSACRGSCRHLSTQAAQSRGDQIHREWFQEQSVTACFERRRRTFRCSHDGQNADRRALPCGGTDGGMVELAEIPVHGDHARPPSFDQANGFCRGSGGEAGVRTRRKSLDVLGGDRDDEWRARIRRRRMRAHVRREFRQRFSVGAWRQHRGSFMPPSFAPRIREIPYLPA